MSRGQVLGGKQKQLERINLRKVAKVASIMPSQPAASKPSKSFHAKLHHASLPARTCA